MNRRISTAIAALLFASVASIASAQVIFTEAFDDAASSAKFSVSSIGLGASGDPAAQSAPTVYSEFGFDYSATGASRLTASIGAAPNGGSTTGLLLAANLDGSNRSSINIFPILAGAGLPVDAGTGLPVADANYKMKFDFWGGINDVGGTTEMLQVGAQSKGAGQHINGFTAATPDSDFFEINIAGDLGNSDFTVFTTRGGAPTLDQAFIPNTDPAAVAAFPNPPYTAQAAGGAPGEAWATAEISHIDGVTTLSFNGGKVITTVDFSDFANDVGYDGLPWFGYTDIFGSQAGGDSTKVAEPGGGSATGDYNGDGTVDAADYTVYRDTLGDSVTPGTGADGDGDGNIDPDDYTEWANNFGNTGGGAGSSFDPFNASFVIVDNVEVELLPAISTTVPEPTSLLLVALGVAGLASRRRNG